MPSHPAPLISAALVALVAVSGQAKSDTQTPARGRRDVPPEIARRVNDVLAAYEAGDDLAVERWFASSAGPATPYLDAFLARAAPWSRARAAFLLEVATHTASAAQLTAGRAMVTARPAPLGADPPEDRFEVLWHHTAIGLLQQAPSVAAQLDYLLRVEPRFDEAARRGISIETRFPLARAFATGLLCCWKPVAGEIVRNFTSVYRASATLEGALGLYEAAAAVPSLRAEAYVRGAKLLLDAGRHDDSLQWLARVPDHGDKGVAWAQHMMRGRIFDTLSRPEDAVEAYGRAAALNPTSQRAAIGLAAALLRAGRADDALRVASSAGTMKENPPTFAPLELNGRVVERPPGEFTNLNRGDARFVQAWLAEIRSLRQ